MGLRAAAFTLPSFKPLSRSSSPAPGGAAALSSSKSHIILDESATANGGGPNVRGGAESYISLLSLRLSESVNKVLTLANKKPTVSIPRGNGNVIVHILKVEFEKQGVIGGGVVSSCAVGAGDLYLLRAIVRTAVKHLSVFAARLDAVALPSIISPAFSAPVLTSPSGVGSATILLPTTGTKEVHPFNPTQLYTISVAHCALEVLTGLQSIFANCNHGAGGCPKFVGDSFRPILEKLEAITTRVIQPLIISVKSELIKSLDAGFLTPPPAAAVQQPKAVKVDSCFSPFGVQVLAAHKALALISSNCGADGEAWATSVLVSVIWRGMSGVVERNWPLGGGISPRALSLRLASSGKLSAMTTSITPAILADGYVSLTPQVANKSAQSASRPNSPPRHSNTDCATLMITSFEALVVKLDGGLVPTAPHLIAAAGGNTLAREALSEAFEALKSLRVVIAVMARPGGVGVVLQGLKELKEEMGKPEEEEEEGDDEFLDALEDVPAVLLCHLFLTRIGKGHVIKGPREVLALADYDSTVLGGFGKAEEWWVKVAQALKFEIEALPTATSASEIEVDLLNAIALVCEVRAGVKCSVPAFGV